MNTNDNELRAVIRKIAYYLGTKHELISELQSLIHRENQEVCVCAAVKATDGSIYRGHRHAHCIQAIRDEGKEVATSRDSQGFITTRNRYVDREEGRKLQDAAGIESASGYMGNTLYSEDLYNAERDVVINNPTK